MSTNAFERLQKSQNEPLKTINITLDGEALEIVLSYNGKSAKASASDLILLGHEYYELLQKQGAQQTQSEAWDK